MIIYIAGPMAGCPDENREAFQKYETALKKKGDIILNPAWLPKGLQKNDYMPICLAMLQAADAIFLMPGWRNSKGANLESEFAKYQGKMIIEAQGKPFGWERENASEWDGVGDCSTCDDREDCDSERKAAWENIGGEWE